MAVRYRSQAVYTSKRERIVQRAQYRCQSCGSKPDAPSILEVHHVRPWLQGGRHNDGNLVVLCKNCHLLIHKWLRLPRLVERVSSLHTRTEELLRGDTDGLA